MSWSKALLQGKDRTSMWKDLKKIKEKNGINIEEQFKIIKFGKDEI